MYVYRRMTDSGFFLSTTQLLHSIDISDAVRDKIRISNIDMCVISIISAKLPYSWLFMHERKRKDDGITLG
jgi:hypothetical protein